MSKGSALVTGGAGFIGSHLCGRLLREGWAVRVLDNLSTGSEENLRDLRSDLHFILGDVRDPAICREACRGIDVVFHLAALASVKASVDDPAACHAINVTGTVNVLIAAREAGVRRLIYSSSASVYGDAGQQPTREDQPLRPQSPYATAKIAGEFYCKNFAELYQLETVCLRYFNVFGPNQSTRSDYAAVIPLFIEALAQERRPVIYGDGRQTRDFIYVDNVATANLLAAVQPQVSGRVFNIAAGRGICLLDLLSSLGGLVGVRPEPLYRPARPGDIRYSIADISLASRLLRYQPSVPFDSGLGMTVEGIYRSLGRSRSLAAVA